MGGCYHGCSRHSRRAIGSRAQRAAAQGGDRIDHRHDDRVVRLLPLRHRRRAGLRQALLPQLRPADRRRCWPSAPISSASSRRPIGAAIFGHYGDRIGRKATLIATLLCMGIATFLVAFVPTYASIGIWGAVILTVLRLIQGIGVGGEWGGSVLLAMEWSRTHGQRGLVASWPQFGVPCGLFLANLAVLAFSAWSGDQFLTWGWRIPFALSIILVGVGLWIRLGILETPVFQQLLDEQTRSSGRRSLEVIKRQPQRDHPVGAAAHGRAGAVLHLHRLHLRLRGRHAEDVARLHSCRGAGAPRASRSSPFRCPATSPTASAAGRCI